VSSNLKHNLLDNKDANGLDKRIKGKPCLLSSPVCKNQNQLQQERPNQKNDRQRKEVVEKRSPKHDALLLARLYCPDTVKLITGRLKSMP
jgi:hypothetical protein